jgi:hypothetical protein
VTVRLAKYAKVGRFSEQVQISTSLDKAQTITIPVYADVVGPLEVTPPSVSVSFRQDSPREIPNVIQVRRRDGKSLRVLGATADSGPVRASVKRALAGTDPAEVEVVVSRPENPAYGHTKLKIQTNDALQPTVEVIVSWVVPQAPAAGAPVPGAFPGGPPPSRP